MKLIVLLVCVLFLNVCNVLTGHQSDSQPYYNHDVTIIPLRIHIDKPLHDKLTILYKTKYKTKIRVKIQNVLHKVQTLLSHPTLNESIVLNVKEIRFLRKNSKIEMNENLNVYLKSYCEWQAAKKLKAEARFYSVMLTGLDLYYEKRGLKDRSRTGRAYLGGMCTSRKSCAIVEWDDATKIAYNIAHEIGHSLGIYHDPPTKGYRTIMAKNYVYKRTKETWSPTSRSNLKKYLSSQKAWCLRPSMFYH